MLFGRAYEMDMGFEIFLRYLEPGIQKINSIREKLCFIPNKNFARILKSACERGLISVNAKHGTLFVSQKTMDVIRFIEQYDFINELQLKELDNGHKFDKHLNGILTKTGYDHRKYHDCQTELAYAMRSESNGEDYLSEILKFKFYIQTNGNKANLEL
jgi:hypothetical protein